MIRSLSILLVLSTPALAQSYPCGYWKAPPTVQLVRCKPGPPTVFVYRLTASMLYRGCGGYGSAPQIDAKNLRTGQRWTIYHGRCGGYTGTLIQDFNISLSAHKSGDAIELIPGTDQYGGPGFQPCPRPYTKFTVPKPDQVVTGRSLGGENACGQIPAGTLCHPTLAVRTQSPGLMALDIELAGTCKDSPVLVAFDAAPTLPPVRLPCALYGNPPSGPWTYFAVRPALSAVVLTASGRGTLYLPIPSGYPGASVFAQAVGYFPTTGLPPLSGASDVVQITVGCK